MYTQSDVSLLNNIDSPFRKLGNFRLRIAGEYFVPCILLISEVIETVYQMLREIEIFIHLIYTSRRCFI